MTLSVSRRTLLTLTGRACLTGGGAALLAACSQAASVTLPSSASASTAASSAASAARTTAPATSTAAASPSAPVASGTVRVLTFSNPLFQEAKQDLVAAFAKTDPNLTAQIDVFPGQIDQFRQKVLALYAGGDIPDAQWIHPSITSLMGAGKLVRPLDALAAQDKDTPLSSFYPGVLAYFAWQGTTFALPWYGPGYALVFNKDLFVRLGLDTPDKLSQEKKWAWDDFVATLRGLTRPASGSDGSTIGMQAESTNLDWVAAWIWRNGGDVFSPDLKACVLNADPAVEAIQDYADLFVKYQVMEYSANKKDYPNDFIGGRIGLMQMDKEQVAPARNNISRATFQLGMTPIYVGKTGPINRSGPLGFAVAAGAAHADAGWRWVRFMAGPEASAVLMSQQATLPVRPDFAKLPQFAQSMEPWENKDVWLQSQADARPLPQPAQYDQIATLWTQTWAAILTQKQTVKALLEDMVRQANALLAKGS